MTLSNKNAFQAELRVRTTRSWSHLVPSVVQIGPTVHTLAHPRASFHGLSSQVKGDVEACYLLFRRRLFPTEKRKVGGSIPPLTTRRSSHLTTMHLHIRQ